VRDPLPAQTGRTASRGRSANTSRPNRSRTRPEGSRLNTPSTHRAAKPPVVTRRRAPRVALKRHPHHRALGSPPKARTPDRTSPGDTACLSATRRQARILVKDTSFPQPTQWNGPTISADGGIADARDRGLTFPVSCGRRGRTRCSQGVAHQPNLGRSIILTFVVLSLRWHRSCTRGAARRRSAGFEFGARPDASSPAWTADVLRSRRCGSVAPRQGDEGELLSHPGSTARHLTHYSRPSRTGLRPGRVSREDLDETRRSV
jgi:hypothetical protein